jgi:hypothetical protein
MKINIELDIPSEKVKYKRNDFILVLNITNNRLRTVLVDRVLYMGRFVYCPECGKDFIHLDSIIYNTIAQEDSWEDTESPIPIRPGTIIKFKQEELELYPKITYDKEITTSDNVTNIRQREKEWRSKVAKIMEDLNNVRNE